MGKYRSSLLGRQFDRPTRNHESAPSEMMKCARVLHAGINPSLEYFQYEKVVLAHHSVIDDLAFEIGEALDDEWWSNQRCLGWRQMEFLELIQPAPGAVTYTHDLLRQIHRRNVEHAFFGRLQRREAVVVPADDAAHERWFEVHHRVPRHRHDVCSPLVSGRHHHHRSWFQQAVDARQR